MEKGDTIFTYLNKLTTCRDEICSVGITTADEYMVSLSLLGLPKSWNSYHDSVNGREKLFEWERLWSDLTQEEIRRSTQDGSSSNNDDEENLAFASKARKGKGKASHSKSNSSHGRKKVDKSKVGCVWYLDSGAPFHMIGDKILFITLEEKDLKMRIEMGDDRKYIVSGWGTIAFQREHRAPITLTDVKYVHGLKKSLVSVTMLEEKGYDVVFSKGKVFLIHIPIGQTKRIGIQVENLYKLEVDDCVALSMKVELVQSQDIGELWHKRLGHLHHGTLKIMQ
eukprot:PITA_23493